jgi:methionine sulfoxide reductase heme-binding subunit
MPLVMHESVLKASPTSSAGAVSKPSLSKALLHPAAKPLIFTLCLLPFAWLLFAAITDQLGANPAEALVRSTGDWTLRFVCIVLAVTPLRTSYSWFDMEFVVADIIKDIIKRPFILVGFSAFVLLTPLAATSFNRAIKTLGAKRWQLLHKLVYVIAGLGLLHFFWMRSGKNDFAEVAVYAAILGALLGWRLWRRLKSK